MKTCHHLTIIAVIVTAQYAIAAAAHAAPNTELRSTQLEQGKASQPKCGDAAIAPVPTYIAMTSSALTKSAAVLGQPSQLQLIMQRQSGGSQKRAEPPTVVHAVLGQNIVPALPGRCQATESSRTDFARISPIAIPNSGDFLGSKRIRVKQTSFDSSWNRVRKHTISAGVASPLLRSMSGKQSFSKLEKVNSWTNKHVRYVEDRVLYGEPDYWANAGTTIARAAGDCEDIAIVKMQLLAALGVPRSDMYLTVARDTIRHADHALLVVRMEGRNWLLDNSTDEILNANGANDYNPIFSYSNNRKWIHGVGIEQTDS